MGNVGSNAPTGVHPPPTPSWAPPPPFDLLLLHFQLLHHLLKLLLLGLQHLVKALKLLKGTRGEEKSHGQQSAPEVRYRPSRPGAPWDAVQAGPYGSQLGAKS